jgi:hypothetical protein
VPFGVRTRIGNSKLHETMVGLLDAVTDAGWIALDGLTIPGVVRLRMKDLDQVFWGRF